MAIRQDVLIFWKPGNIMAEMQGCQELKQFVRKGGMSVSQISQSRCLSGTFILHLFTFTTHDRSTKTPAVGSTRYFLALA